MIRQAQDQFGKIPGTDTKGRPFQIMQEMLSLLGGTYEDTQNVLTSLGYKSEIRENLPDLPKPDENQTEATSSSPKSESTEEQEDTTSKSDSTQAPASATEEKDSEKKSEESGAAKPSKPKKSSGRKDLSLYNNRVTNDDGSVSEIANKEVWLIPARGQKGFKPKGANAQGKKPRQKGPKGGAKPVYSSGRPGGSAPKGKASIKNSPFAALAALNIDESNKSGKKDKSKSDEKSDSQKDSKKS